MKPLDPDLKARLLQWSAGGGAASLVLIVATNPDLVQKILANWPGAIFGIVCVGFVLVDRRAGQGITALREMAEANRGLTGAVQQMAERTDSVQIANEALLRRIGRNQEAMFEELHAISDKIEALRK